MEKNYKELLENQAKKTNAFFAIISKETFCEFLSTLAFILVVGFLTFIDYRYGIKPSDAFLLDIILCIFFSLFEMSAIIAIVYILRMVFIFLFKLFTVEIPVLLNRRYLPLTEEEIKNLNLSEQEFAEFVEYCCSKKRPKQICYSSFIMDDIEELMKIYCKTYVLIDKNFCYEYEKILKYFSDEMKEHIKECNCNHLL